MFFLNKQRHKPIYKKFINLRSNILNNKKIFHFKKQKWNVFIFHLIKNSKRYRHKPYTLNNFHIPRFASSGNSFKKQFRTNLQNKKKFNIFYGGLLKKKLQKQIKLILHSKQNKDFNSSFIELLESRLDSVLFRSYFSSSLRNSGQLISHGCIIVNNKIITDKSYLLKPGDLISINPKYHNIIPKKFKKLSFWSNYFWFCPVPPSYLVIKYKTMQIVFGDTTNFNFSAYFPFFLNINAIFKSYRK